MHGAGAPWLLAAAGRTGQATALRLASGSRQSGGCHIRCSWLKRPRRGPKTEGYWLLTTEDMATLSYYQKRYGFDPYDRGHNMYFTAARNDNKPPTRDHHIWSARGLRQRRAGGGAAFLVESQRVRGAVYTVTANSCTCEDFRRKSATDPNYQCKHIYVWRIDQNGGRPVPRRRR